MLFDKLRQIEERSEELARALGDPALYGNPSEYARLRKEHADTIEIVERFRQYRDVLKRLTDARQLLTDGDRELAELAQVESSDSRRSTSASRWRLRKTRSEAGGIELLPAFSLSIGAPRPAGPQPRDGRPRALPRPSNGARRRER